MVKKIQEPRVILQVSVDPHLAYKLKLRATEKKIQQREAVVEAITEWLQKPDF